MNFVNTALRAPANAKDLPAPGTPARLLLDYALDKTQLTGAQLADLVAGDGSRAVNAQAEYERLAKEAAVLRKQCLEMSKLINEQSAQILALQRQIKDGGSTSFGTMLME